MCNIKVEKPYVVIFLFALLFQGVYLLNDGVFWDDWVLFNMSDAGIKYMYVDNGGGAAGYLFHQLINRFINPVFINHLIGFITSAVVAILLFKILNMLNVFTGNQGLLITLIFIALPIDVAGYTMICSLAKLYFSLTILGFYFFLKIEHNNGLLYRLLALCSFMVSFIVPSIISFYLGVMMLYFIRRNFSDFSIKKLIEFSFKRIDFIVLPFISWYLFKLIFAPPADGLHAATGYNAIHFKNILQLPLVFKHSFVDLFRYSFFETLNLYGLLGTLGFVTVLLTVSIKLKINKESSTQSARFYMLLFTSGLILFFAGSLSYVLVGKMPVMEYNGTGFNSRHQLLLGIGLSFIIFSIIEASALFFKAKLNVKYIYVVVFFLFFSSSVYSLMQYKRDWIKQQVIMNYFRTNEVIKTNNAFIVVDETIDYNAFGRKISFYEYSGMLKYALGDESRLAISQSNFNAVKKWYKNGIKEFDGVEGFNLGDFKFDYFDYKILIKKGETNITNLDLLQSIFSKDWVNKEGEKLLKFELEKIENGL